MSKYEPLWEWIKANGKDSFKLTFAEIEKIAGLPTDHSFLTYKKELTYYNIKVRRISIKSVLSSIQKKVFARFANY